MKQLSLTMPKSVADRFYEQIVERYGGERKKGMCAAGAMLAMMDLDPEEQRKYMAAALLEQMEGHSPAAKPKKLEGGGRIKGKRSKAGRGRKRGG